MNGLLLDTHAWVWFLSDNPNMPKPLTDSVKIASRAYVSAISAYEIAQKIRLGRWPGMTSDLLDRMIADENVELLPLGPKTLSAAGQLDWEHRDPFDRMIAATAIEAGLELVSKDGAFDHLKAISRKWA